MKSSCVSPFPRQNDRAVMLAMTNVFWAVTWVWPLLPLLPLLLVVGLCRCCCGGRAAAREKPTSKAKARSKKVS